MSAQAANRGSLFIELLPTGKKQSTQNIYHGQTPSQAQTLIDAAFSAGTITRISYSFTG